jgi:hypothetical protein
MGPSLRVKNNKKDSVCKGQERKKDPKKNFRLLKVGDIGSPETSVRNYYCSLHDNPEKFSSYKLIIYM